MISASTLEVPAQMTPRERLLLFALARASCPKRVLEIGSCEGGSTLLLHRALEPSAALVVIEPTPRWTADTRGELEPRTVLVEGRSPAALPLASHRAGGHFDFVFVDGDHTAAGVEGDLIGITTYLEPGATVLLHDAHYWGVSDGIARVLALGVGYADAGLLAVEPTPEVGRVEAGRPVIWGGLRMLRFSPKPLRP